MPLTAISSTSSVPAADEIPLELLPSSSSDTAGENTNAHANILSDTCIEAGIIETTDAQADASPEPNLQSNAQTGVNTTSLCNDSLLSLKVKLKDGLEYLEKPTVLLGVVIGILCAVIAFMGYHLQAWTARKDYLEYCKDAIDILTGPAWQDCRKALETGLPPPPGFHSNAVTTSTEPRRPFYVGSKSADPSSMMWPDTWMSPVWALNSSVPTGLRTIYLNVSTYYHTGNISYSDTPMFDDPLYDVVKAQYSRPSMPKYDVKILYLRLLNFSDALVFSLLCTIAIASIAVAERMRWVRSIDRLWCFGPVVLMLSLAPFGFRDPFPDALWWQTSLYTIGTMYVIRHRPRFSFEIGSKEQAEMGLSYGTFRI